MCELSLCIEWLVCLSTMDHYLGLDPLSSEELDDAITSSHIVGLLLKELSPCNDRSNRIHQQPPL